VIPITRIPPSHQSRSSIDSIAKIWLWSSNFTSHHIQIQHIRPDTKKRSASPIRKIVKLIPASLHTPKSSLLDDAKLAFWIKTQNRLR